MQDPQDFSAQDNIINLLGLEAWPEAKRAAFLGRTADLLQRRIMLRILSRLSDDDADQAEMLVDKPEELMAYVFQRVPEAKMFATEELARIKQELAGVVDGREEKDGQD